MLGSMGMSLERSTGAMSLPIGCWVKDEAGTDNKAGGRHWSVWGKPKAGRPCVTAVWWGDEEGLN